MKKTIIPFPFASLEDFFSRYTIHNQYYFLCFSWGSVVWATVCFSAHALWYSKTSEMFPVVHRGRYSRGNFLFSFLLKSYCIIHCGSFISMHKSRQCLRYDLFSWVFSCNEWYNGLDIKRLRRLWLFDFFLQIVGNCIS